MKQILFVCTGNTCRSPMAEGLFNSAVARDTVLKGKYIASSAGIAAFDGSPASQNSVEALHNKWQIDISTHHSRHISKADPGSAYLILTMTQSHKAAVLSAFPQYKTKVYTLKEYVSGLSGKSADIPDPYGLNIDAYLQCAGDIKEAVDMLVMGLKSKEVPA